ncbi:MAG TPA: GAF domain-containing protein [Fulvivirga sp.]|nr:GAF domain-containing protein [Fulvivirga sp.]
MLPILVLFISLYNKSWAIELGILNPVNYFDVRIVLLNAIIIPIVLFSLKEKKWLIPSALPAYLIILLFDPIHNYFGVGYFQAGLLGDDYYFSTNLYTIITLTFFTFVMIFLKHQVLKSDLRQSDENRKVKRYLRELVRLSNSQNINNGKVDEAKMEIIRSVKECLNISRISIWRYDEQKQCISCEFLSENNKIEKSQTTIHLKDYPDYFSAIKENKLVIASDAIVHHATADLADKYLMPNSIRSLMDAPFLVRGKLGGIICCEQQNKVKNWEAIESLFLKALGDFLSYAIIVDERIKQNQLLKLRNNEISQINDNLEVAVAERTKELKEKNEQLVEYAYINSHILRAPVARISGLYHLFQFEKEIDLEGELFNHLNESINELENITLQINRAIEENVTFNRSHISIAPRPNSPTFE